MVADAWGFPGGGGCWVAPDGCWLRWVDPIGSVVFTGGLLVCCGVCATAGLGGGWVCLASWRLAAGPSLGHKQGLVPRAPVTVVTTVVFFSGGLCAAVSAAEVAVLGGRLFRGFLLLGLAHFV